MNKETLIVKIEGRIQALKYVLDDEIDFQNALPDDEILKLVSKVKSIRYVNEINHLSEIVEDLRDVQI